jgi:hypothetical protein
MTLKEFAQEITKEAAMGPMGSFWGSLTGKTVKRLTQRQAGLAAKMKETASIGAGGKNMSDFYRAQSQHGRMPGLIQKAQSAQTKARLGAGIVGAGVGGYMLGKSRED